MSRPTMLILSYSPIAGDARVLKQIERFSRRFDVTTLGYGPAPDGVVEHIEMPREVRYDDLDGRLITLRLYRWAYWKISAVRWSRQRLSRRSFDVAIANDVEAVPVALGVRPVHGVLADLHEYSPLLHDDIPAWRLRITPWFNWVIRRYVVKAQAFTTVSKGLADEFERNFGFRAELVTNAAPYQDMTPSPVGQPIRLVHSGAGLRNRLPHLMAEAAATATENVTIDFYLTLNDPGYVDELKAFAETTERVRVLDPVPYSELLAILNDYDVGVHMLPPTTFNNRNALPNKLFDFIQARLGIVVGPTKEMAEYVNEYGLGEVSAGFTVEDLRATFESLSVARVEAFKSRAHAVAHELSGERQVDIWERVIARMMRNAT